MIDAATLARLEAHAAEVCAARPPAHDALHVARVVALGRTIAEAAGARVDVVVAAAALHELVNLPKDHPESARSGDLCAVEAERVLAAHGVAAADREAVVACIRDHAFSKGAPPKTREAAILQDADRLDAMGAIGIARCFATCTEMGRPFYDPADPFARGRPVDDARFGIDHFFRKLLRLEEGMHTEAARRLARGRTETMRAYLRALEAEIA